MFKKKPVQENKMSNSPPEKTFGDHIHLTTRTLLSSVPVVGGPALELFNAVISPPLERRRNAWMNGVAERLDALKRDGRLKFEDLANNEEFISAVMQASATALRNHQQEKIKALCNAVLNSALGQSPEDAKREMFLAFVDQFTVWHLKVVRELCTPARPDGQSRPPKTSVSDIAEVAMERVPALKGQQAWAEMIVDDLCRKGLLFWGGAQAVTYIPLGTRQVNLLGEEFLRFISEP